MQYNIIAKLVYNFWSQNQQVFRKSLSMNDNDLALPTFVHIALTAIMSHIGHRLVSIKKMSYLTGGDPPPNRATSCI